MTTLHQTNVTVTTAPALIFTSRIGGSRIKIGNESGKQVFYGAAGVTKDNGISIAANAIETLDLSSSCDVYAVVATGTASITILEY